MSLQDNIWCTGCQQLAILQTECQKMTFKAKSVLQRQWCNAWTEFRRCVLMISGTLSVGWRNAPLTSFCYTNRVSHLLFSRPFLWILIQWLRQDCTHSLMPSSDCHIYPTTRRTCLCHPACMRGGPGSVRLGGT